MEKMKNSLGKLIVCFGEAAVGVVLLIDPESFTKVVLVAVGILFCVLGALAVIGYFRMDPAEAALSQELIRGLLGLAAGVFLVYKADWLINHLMPVTIIYGVAALFLGIVKLQWTVDMVRLHSGFWPSAALTSALSILLAVVILANPFHARRTLWAFAGIVLIVTAVSTLFSAVLKPGKKNNLEP